MAILDATKLRLYNTALRRIGERSLADLTVENRAPRYTLDEIWDDSRIVRWLLEQHDWNFATSAVQIDAAISITPVFGYLNAFEKPTDLVRLTSIAHNEFFHNPMNHQQYKDEGGYWVANVPTVWVRYVSDAANKGFNDAGWSQSFFEALSWKMALEAALRGTESGGKVEMMERGLEKAMSRAQGLDGLQEGSKSRPTGSWVAARGA